MPQKQRLVFFGSPEFALAPLKTLYLGGYEIVGIYSQEPKKKSRGMKEVQTPVHRWAESQLLPVFTPAKLNENSLKEFKLLKPDIAILFAYGKLIPSSWLNVPLFGFVNIHASLLPRWRGAAPVQRAIENNDKTTGITIMKMNDSLDEGPIISSQEVTINSETTGKSLIEKMSQDSCSLLYNTLKEYLSGKANLTDQDHSKSTYAAKIKKSENQINWSLTNIELELKIRAFYPYPAMWFAHKGVRYKVLKVKLSKVDGPPGLIVDTPLTIACQKGSIEILEIQQEGKKSMSIDQFKLGNHDFLQGSKLINE
jgi:methionyl-tRNA formyltransferase